MNTLKAAIAVTLLFILASAASAQTDAADAEATKKAALAWLDDFSKRQVLFHPDDVKKLQARVEAMTPDEAVAWWNERESQREALSSPEWLETEKWLGEFFEVQAIYSDDEIRAFQAEAAKEAKDSAESLQEVLDRITQARKKLVGGAQIAAEQRKMQVSAVEAFKQEQVRQREEAARQARLAAPSPAATSPSSAADRNRRRSPRYNEPLVDSLDAARWSVIRGVFPRL